MTVLMFALMSLVLLNVSY